MSYVIIYQNNVTGFNEFYGTYDTREEAEKALKKFLRSSYVFWEPPMIQTLEFAKDLCRDY